MFATQRLRYGLIAVWAVSSLLCAERGNSAADAAQCIQGNVRLEGGDTAGQGRVEVCNSNAWWRVCKDHFGTTEASIVCKQLGLSENGIRLAPGSYFGDPGPGPILLMSCSGNEQRISNCSIQPSVNRSCASLELAGVLCEELGFSCGDGDVRLVSGITKYEGRVEVCRNNTFGTVCNDLSWGIEEAQVVCGQLGYNISGAIATEGTVFGAGVDPMFLDGLQCFGTETDLLQCAFQRSPLRDYFCSTHTNDAGVICPSPNKTCSDGDVRLVNGRRPSEGRVEICFNGDWGTICHYGWGQADAAVVCSQLGYPSEGAIPIVNGDFGPGDSYLFLSDVGCAGNESSLLDCDHPFDIGTAPFCTHNMDAGVICADPSFSCTNGEVRLVNGTAPHEGRLEICYGNHFGTICQFGFGQMEAGVVCQQLGYNGSAIGLWGAPFGRGTGLIHLVNVQCQGNESSLLHCDHALVDMNTYCDHSQDISILCAGNSSGCVDGDLRLVGGPNQQSGRVEVCFSGVWGTICHNGWNDDDATVVCRQLGYRAEGAIGLSSAYYGEGRGFIFLDEVRCDGNATSILQCIDGGLVGVQLCVHGQDASVVCGATNTSNQTCSNGQLRLVGGGNVGEGRLEVCIRGTWGTVCNEGWSNVEASVACRELGYSPTDATTLYGAFPYGNGSILLSSLSCRGDEQSLFDCSYDTPDLYVCDHFQDVTIACKSASQTCSHGQLRLVGGAYTSDGRVEVCTDGLYGTVCGDLWTNQDAAVVCRQMGFDAAGAVSILDASVFGPGSGRISLTRVECLGNESSLVDCPHSSTTGYCTHNGDASVLCQSDMASSVCSTGEARLTGGAESFKGKVEVCINGHWGAICSEGGWGYQGATVVCKQLGFNSGALTTASVFGDRSSLALLSGVVCTGAEANLIGCSHGNIAQHSCSAAQAAAICLVGNLTSGECAQGAIRLTGVGPYSYVGFVEVCINGNWTALCPSLPWDNRGAAAVCSQLGYPSAGARTWSGDMSGHWYLSSDLQCTGNEASVWDCPSSTRHVQSTCRGGVANAICKVPMCQGQELQLVGGARPNEGTIQACFQQEWVTVCDDIWFDVNAAVTCRQLGFTQGTAVPLRFSHYGDLNTSLSILTSSCVGQEAAIQSCDFTLGSCPQGRQAGVLCPSSNDSAICTNGDIRLVGGASAWEGRVELCFNGIWGTVCGYPWTQPDAQVVCKQLGLGTRGAIPAINAFFGQGLGPVFLSQVECTGNESALLECSRYAVGVQNCHHYDDAGVICRPDNTTVVCSDGDIRLRGAEPHAGIIEMCVSSVWRSVCASSQSRSEGWANVSRIACEQLDLETQGVSADYISDGTYVASISCIGTETSLGQCLTPQQDVTSYNCYYLLNAQCQVPECRHKELRLVGGATRSEGAVQMCVSHGWSAVCDRSWSSVAALVVCRQLGASQGSPLVLKGSVFGTLNGSTGEVYCKGNETVVQDCSYTAISCSSSNLAAVVCPNSSLVCNTGSLRLVDGDSQYEGRVEMCLGNQWGTLCSESWSSIGAQVVCTQLGYTDNGYAYGLKNAAFGMGTNPILNGELACNGTETALLQCYRNVERISCGHSEDIGVLCPYRGSSCPNGAVRLIGGRLPSEGRVEVCLGGVWGTVCHDERSWSLHSAEVVCGQLGYGHPGAQLVPPGAFGAGDGPIHFSHLLCTGTEPSLIHCVERPLFSTLCTHQRDAGVICKANTTLCQNGSVRLTSGTSHMGRLEVCLGGTFGSVCDENWNTTGASVVCRQLGLSSQGAMSLGPSFFGGGVGLIQLKDVVCRGNETFIMECRHQQPGLKDSACSAHTRDVSVLCTATNSMCNHGDVRLVGGGSDLQGRVEFCAGGEWTTICSNGWDKREASVVCRQLGHSGDGAITLTGNLFGEGTGYVFMQNVGCLGNETQLLQCLASATGGHGCTHSQDVEVICRGSNTPSLVSSLAVGPSAVVPSPTAVSSETSHQLSPTTMAAIIVPILIVVIAVLIIITVIVAVVALKFLKPKLYAKSEDVGGDTTPITEKRMSVLSEQASTSL
ncbi:hypothetical protein EMCRGX_G033781 [Ephydatia muelleri]